jgi:hypothetical protein
LTGLVVAGFAVRSQIIWAKDRLVLSQDDYHWQHEPCRYAVKKSGKGHWASDRKQTTLWRISGKDQDAATVHGTQKPVECMRRPMLNNSSPGQAVFEPFMGSGTTLIAAETTGRVEKASCTTCDDQEEQHPAQLDHHGFLRWGQRRSQLKCCVGAVLKAGSTPPAINGVERHPVARCKHRSRFAAGCNLRPDRWGRRRVLVQR